MPGMLEARLVARVGRTKGHLGCELDTVAGGRKLVAVGCELDSVAG